MPAELVQKFEPVQCQTVSRFDSGDCRSARTIAEQRHFAECATGSDRADLMLLSVAAGPCDRNFAGRDHEKRDATLSLAENRGAGVIVTRMRGTLQRR